MKKIFEVTSKKSMTPEDFKAEISQKLESGYFRQWGEFKYKWAKKNILYVSNENGGGAIVFLKTKLSINISSPVIRVRGEIIFSENGKLVCYADIPFWAKHFMKPAIKKIMNEIKKMI